MSQNIVVAGYGIGADTHQQFAVIRYLPDGSRDTSFGTGGLALTSFGVGSDSTATALAVQGDGKYVAAGLAPVAAVNGFALARYNTDGTIDTGFGTSGLVKTNFIGATDSRVQGVAVQGDGKIVVAGNTTVGTDFLFALIRYNTDGTLDTGFGTGGKVTTSFGESPATDGAFAVLIQGDGKIVAVGLSNANPLGTGFGLARYNTDGSLDTVGFGTGGKVSTDFGGNGAQGFAAALQGDGKIVAAGLAQNGGGNVGFGLARYNTDGSLDTVGFGTGGLVTTLVGGASGSTALAVTVQGDGKIVAAGLFGTAFAAARYNTDGTLDSGFGTGGTVLLPAPVASEASDQFGGVAVQADGKVVAAGFRGSIAIGGPDFGTVRYTSVGILDSGFGTAGLVDDDVNGPGFPGGEAFAIVLGPDVAPASSTDGPILLTLV